MKTDQGAAVLDDVRASFSSLRRHACAAVAMVWLSVGGHVAYLSAAELDLAAVVVAYAGWLPTGDIPPSRPEPTVNRTPAITARVLFLVGADDHVVPPEHRRTIIDALRAAHIRHDFVEYPNVPYGFLCDRRGSYVAAVAGDAWHRIERLLRRPRVTATEPCRDRLGDLAVMLASRRPVVAVDDVRERTDRRRGRDGRRAARRGKPPRR